jgi:hypothetical protein
VRLVRQQLRARRLVPPQSLPQDITHRLVTFNVPALALLVALLDATAVYGASLAATVPTSVPVTVTNTAATPVPITAPNPIPVTTPDREVFQAELDAVSTNACFTIPAGKRLVVQFASFNVIVPTGMAGLIFVRTTVGGGHVRYTIPLTRLTAGGTDYLSGAIPLTAYADANTLLCAEYSGFAGPFVDLPVAISGYFIGMPQ